MFIAGRGARGAGCRQALEALAAASGALLATGAVASGLFNGSPWNIGISGGFASPLARELIRGADLLVGWGCALNMWTMSHGALIGPGATVAQVDLEPEALGRHRRIDVGVVGDVRATAEAVTAALPRRPDTGYRTPAVAERIAARIRWNDEPTEDLSTADRIDPRVLSTVLDEILPRERVVATDSGNFQGYPSAYLSVPDEFGFCMTQAYQSIGLGLATAIGAALAQPHRLPVAALGDGGALMGASELETVVRLGLPMVVVVYDDEGYGAEVHHFAGDDLSTCVFPDTDIAAIGRGYGFEGVDGPHARRPRRRPAVGRRAAGQATARRRQGRQGPPVVVAGGGVPRPLNGGRRRQAMPSAAFSASRSAAPNTTRLRVAT